MMKYIQLKYAGFIVFDQQTKHKEMRSKFPNDTLISAGFVSGTMEKDQIWCEGESASLGRGFDENDSDSLHRRISIY